MPTTVAPINYQLTLKPNLEQFTVDGEVTVEIEVKFV